MACALRGRRGAGGARLSEARRVQSWQSGLGVVQGGRCDTKMQFVLIFISDLFQWKFQCVLATLTHTHTQNNFSIHIPTTQTSFENNQHSFS